MNDESIAAVAVALAMALESHHEGLTESFARESQRLYAIIWDSMPRERAQAHDGGLMAVGALWRMIQKAKLTGHYDGYDTYAR
ncbi:MAG: hypothetical protein OXC12_18030 [Spirochaetaceae bacterium]|nr:hypothetical protein [Spirochaetaceae bacterium]